MTYRLKFVETQDEFNSHLALAQYVGLYVSPDVFELIQLIAPGKILYNRCGIQVPEKIH